MTALSRGRATLVLQATINAVLAAEDALRLMTDATRRWLVFGACVVIGLIASLMTLTQ